MQPELYRDIVIATEPEPVAHADRHDAVQPFVLSGGRFEHRVDPEVGACRVDFLAPVLV